MTARKAAIQDIKEAVQNKEFNCIYLKFDKLYRNPKQDERNN